MAMFPKIQSPCPYKSDLAAVMDGDFCRMCKRTVFDLSAWSDGERVAFLQSCETEVCVSYRLPLRPVMAAAALAAATMPLAAAAQDAPPAAATEAAVSIEPSYETDIIVGGIKDPKNVAFVEDAADAAIPELPVIYEQAEPAKAKAPAKP